MLGWIGSLRRTAAAPRVAAVAPVVPAPAAPPVQPPPPAPTPSALAWLLQGPPALDQPMSEAENAVLQVLDDHLAADRLPADLVPRAAGVVPQLLALMRQESPSRTVMVQQVLKDPLLTAEVLRVARSSHYGGRPVDTLDTALDRIGTIGLQTATARVLLKPVFQAQGDGLAARAAPRVWHRSEQKSMRCAELAARTGGDRFEGLLAGLLHDIGWLALLRLLDRTGLAVVWPASHALDAALDRRKDALFGRLAAGWDLGPALAALATALQQAPLASVNLPLAAALREADAAMGGLPAETADAVAA